MFDGGGFSAPVIELSCFLGLLKEEPSYRISRLLICVKRSLRRLLRSDEFNGSGAEVLATQEGRAHRRSDLGKGHGAANFAGAECRAVQLLGAPLQDFDLIGFFKSRTGYEIQSSGCTNRHISLNCERYTIVGIVLVFGMFSLIRKPNDD